MDREAWLEQATEVLRRDVFAPVGLEVPQVRVSVGFPRGARGGKADKIGQCWSPQVAGDALHHLFISPVVSDVVSVIGTLAHELVHATVGLKAKHGAAFKRAALSVGLEGKMTATTATAKLAERATLLPFAYVEIGGKHERLGDYPHPTFDPRTLTTDKQTTRLIKVACPQDGYTARITRKWLDDLGTPTCPCGTLMEVSA